MYVSVAACEREILKGKVGAKRECVKGKSCKGRGCVLGHDVCDSPGVHRLAVALLLFCWHIEEQEALTQAISVFHFLIHLFSRIEEIQELVLSPFTYLFIYAEFGSFFSTLNPLTFLFCLFFAQLLSEESLLPI